MENIYELSELVQRSKSTLWTLLPKKDLSQIKRLAVIAFSKSRLTDEECMIKIYGKRKVKAFSSLKLRLIEKMNILLIMQQELYLEKEEANYLRFENIRNYLVAEILITKGQVEMGLRALEKAINIAVKNNFIENVVLISRMLIVGFGSNLYNEYKFMKYLKIQTTYINIYSWEIKSQNYFYELQASSIYSRSSPSGNLILKAFRYVTELDAVKDVKTPLFLYNRYRIKALHLEFSKDYRELLKLSQNAVRDLTSHKLKYSVAINNINIRIILSYIQIENYSEAIKFGKTISSTAPIGSNFWIRINYYLIKASIYNKEYLNAINLINIIYKNKRHLTKYPYYSELYIVLLGYLYLLICSKNITVSVADGILPEFKLGKYLNSMPISNKDKRGINISILLMHIAFLLLRNDYSAIIDRIDSLNQYAYRYLRQDDSFRSNCMIKMVIQMTKADFNPVRTERYTADLLKQLKSVKLAGSGENIEIEVIPFEVLWEIMLKSLKN